MWKKTYGFCTTKYLQVFSFAPGEWKKPRANPYRSKRPAPYRGRALRDERGADPRASPASVYRTGRRRTRVSSIWRDKFPAPRRVYKHAGSIDFTARRRSAPYRYTVAVAAGGMNFYESPSLGWFLPCTGFGPAPPWIFKAVCERKAIRHWLISSGSLGFDLPDHTVLVILVINLMIWKVRGELDGFFNEISLGKCRVFTRFQVVRICKMPRDLLRKKD